MTKISLKDCSVKHGVYGVKTGPGDEVQIDGFKADYIGADVVLNNGASSISIARLDASDIGGSIVGSSNAPCPTSNRSDFYTNLNTGVSLAAIAVSLIAR